MPVWCMCIWCVSVVCVYMVYVVCVYMCVVFMCICGCGCVGEKPYQVGRGFLERTQAGYPLNATVQEYFSGKEATRQKHTQGEGVFPS